MTTEIENPSVQVIGNTFVEQYYHILHQSPDLVYRFYQESSVLSRPEPNGVMSLVTTMEAINDKILSLDHKDYKAEIKTTDAQESYKEGVIVLVTGWLTGKENIKRKFTQSFFLAPQDKGYFVLNDVFRYVDDDEPLDRSPMSINGISASTPTAPLTPDPETAQVLDSPVSDSTTPLVEEDLNNREEACGPSETDEGEVIEEEPLAPSTENIVHPVVQSSSSTVQEEAPKKSYASILKALKGHAPPSRVVPANSEQQLLVSSPPAALAPSSNNASGNSIAHEEVEGHSIYIRNLPLNTAVTQLEEEFKKFGPIKPGGVQVRSNKQQGFCFGFVEFESLSSMLNAIEGSPVTIEGRQAFIEEKRTTSRVGNGRGRFPPGRSGFSNNNFRGRGNFGGNKGNGRNEYGNWGEFSGRGRGPSGHNGEGG